jgi:ketosteroid isomerase-like protein
MKKTHFYLMIPAISLSLLACNSGGKDQTPDAKPINTGIDMQKARSFIDSINAKFTEEFKKGDSVALASHYSTDAEMLFANSEPIKRKDILSEWGGMLRTGIKDFTFATTDITGSGDLLVETGTYEMKTADKKLIDKGKYVVVWKQQNGEWKLYRDIGNTSMPAAAAK